MTGNPPPDEVLGIEDLNITVHDGAATAVRGISLSVHTGEIVGHGGGVGQRQDADLPGGPRRAAAGLRHRAGTISFERQDVTAAVPARLAAAARHRHRGGVPGPLLVPEPVADRRQPADRGAAGQAGPAAPGGPPQGDRAVHRRRPAPAGAGLPPDPGRAVGRHAAAGHDRHRDLLRPAAAHRRRGHHRAGRHHPGGDHRAAARPARPARPGGAVRLPRPGRDQGAVRPGGRVLRGRGGRVRAGRGDHRAAAAPLHPGAAAGRLGRRLPAAASCG